MGYAPFELNCGFIPQLGQCLSMNIKFTGVQQFVQQVQWNLMMAHVAIIESCIVQSHHANNRCTLGVKYSPRDLVYLSTKNLTLPKGRAEKLQPKYIGPYKVVEVHTTASTIKLELPPELTAWWVHPTFHMSLIQSHVPNNDEWFPHHDMATCYDFGTTGEPKWFVDEILAHCWVGQAHLEFQVHWMLGDVMWEPLAECKELKALDEYLELRRVQWPCDLPCMPTLPGHTHHMIN